MIVIEKQGAVIQATNPDYRSPSPLKPGHRGKVIGFSRKSRRRMLILLNRLDYSTRRVVFLTLTIKRLTNGEEAHAILKRFLMRLRRKYPEASGVWRMELQQRGAAHFHLLLFDVPYWPQKDLQKVWEQCTKEPCSIAWIQLIKNRKHAMAYVSKYVAKVETYERSTSLDISPYQHADVHQSQGRVWGWLNYDALPFAPITVLAVADDDLKGYLWFAIRSETDGKCGNQSHIVIAFTDEAEEILNFIRKHARDWTELAESADRRVQLLDRRSIPETETTR